MARARAAIAASPDTPVIANLAPFGDKHFLFSETGRSFIMFGVRGGSWIALGEPVGPAEERLEILWQFRELCDRHGAWPAFYHITPDSLPQFVELGLTFQKLGEEGVPLERFSVEELKNRNLRYTFRHLRDGCRFEIVPVEDVPGILDTLGEISAEWLASRTCARRASRSGGSTATTCAISRSRWCASVSGSSRLPMSGRTAPARAVDRPDAPRRERAQQHHGVSVSRADAVGQGAAIRALHLGMVPLFGLERRRLAPLWSQAGALLFRYGEHFYNFQGLLRFKAKFEPVWEPRYLAAPGGFALPRVLRDVTLLISGGERSGGQVSCPARRPQPASAIGSLRRRRAAGSITRRRSATTPGLWAMLTIAVWGSRAQQLVKPRFHRGVERAGRLVEEQPVGA